VSFGPAAGAVLCFWASLTPSLLPRSTTFQGFVAALSALVGYGLGGLLGWIAHSFGGRLTGSARRRTWRTFAVVAPVGTLLMLVAYVAWENQLRGLVGVDKIGLRSVIVMLLTAGALFVVLLVVARLLRAAVRVIARGLGRFLPAPVAAVIGAVVLGLVAYVLVSGVVSNQLLASLDASFVVINHEFSTDVPAPTSRFVSGGPRSRVSWDDLGRQGRVFVANTPTRAQISSFTGRQAKAPVRAYVGIGTDGSVDLSQEAARAVGELRRLGGFRRSVLNVVTGTGTGWVNENQAKALEYMWDGDTATVSIQYSYLPSWLSYLVDRGRAQEAGRLLFDDVYAQWARMPARRRPRLVVSGESLGSLGAEAAFTGPHDLADRVDGALFVGPTNDNPLWGTITSDRTAGSPEVLPVYHDGSTVRFADKPFDWTSLGRWTGTRIGYLQHPNDPITWWDWSLAWRKPDWLSEPRARDVSPYIRWIPGITMLQVAADQLVADDVPTGQGHRYGQEPVSAWAAILPPPRWTTEDTARLAADLARPGSSNLR
jgi:uncharacterized membrane protein